MKRLILIRHAKAIRPWDAPDDVSRGLTARGRKHANQLGALLVGKGWTPSLGLVSPASRTQETWREIAEHASDAISLIDDGLYLASAETIWHQASAQDGDIAVIGHNPGMQGAALGLARAGRAESAEALAFLEDRFPTGCAALFDFDGSEPSDACLAGFVYRDHLI